MSRTTRSFLMITASLLAMPSLAAAQDAPAAEDAGDAILVYGFGETRQVQTISSADIALLTPGVSPLKAIQKLPGVNFQSADPFGAYEWSTRLSIRGFNQNQLGFTLDEVPLGDMSYGNYNGLHVSRAIIAENIGAATVSQGAGALGTASTSNLGGTVEFTSRAPSDTADIVAAGTYGSEDTVRAFVRAESGDLGGVKGYLSYGYLNAGKWKGDGRQRHHQVNAKLVGEVLGGTATAFLNFSDRRENDYQDMSAEMIDRLGSDWDNFAKDWALAVQVARIAANRGDTASVGDPALGTTYPAPITSVDDAYYDASGLRRDWLGGLTVDVPLSDALNFKLTGYYHNNHGQGLWWTPYVPSPTGAPISVRTTEYDIKRPGAIGRLTLNTGPNEMEVGVWYEGNDFVQARRFYSLDNVLTASSRNSLKFQSDPFFTQWEIDFSTDTFQYHVKDSLDLGENVTVSGGWKGVKVNNSAQAIVAGSLPSGDIESRDWFLPQVGAVARLGDAEVFANYTQNMRALVSAATSGPFSTNQAGFNAIRGTLEPERSETYELGARFRSGIFQGSIAAYYVDFTNRLLSLAVGSSIVGNPSALQNVGSVKSYGFEAAGTVRPVDHLSISAAYAYNKSEYKNDVIDGNGVLIAATDGKTVVDSPRHIASAEVAYDSDLLFGRIGANYMSKRYFTYLNDQFVKDRTVVDASIGIKIPAEGMLSGFAIEASVTNLFDTDYVSTVGSGGFGNSGDRQTLLPGAPRQVFVTLRKGF